jgi:hypothetical protein
VDRCCADRFEAVRVEQSDELAGVTASMFRSGFVLALATEVIAEITALTDRSYVRLRLTTNGVVEVGCSVP